MRTNSQMLDWAKGRVSGHFIDLTTGKKQGAFELNNTITYSGADIMARLVAGDTRYAPGYMGFVYGSTPPGTEPPVSRMQTWDTIKEELTHTSPASNVLIAPLSSGPAYSVDGNEEIYSHNAVTLTAHTGTRLEYGFPTGGVYADELADNNNLWYAMLLTRIVSGSTVTYIPFARVTLKNAGQYPVKPENFELALFWQVSYF